MVSVGGVGSQPAATDNGYTVYMPFPVCVSSTNKWSITSPQVSRSILIAAAVTRRNDMGVAIFRVLGGFRGAR